METNTNKQIVDTKLVNYFQKTSNHLFIRNGKFFKVMLVQDKQGDNYVVTLEFNEKGCSLDIKPIKYWHCGTVTELIENGKLNSAYNYQKSIWKHCSLFTEWNGKCTSIKNFKLMKEKMNDIRNLINESDNIHMRETILNIQKKAAELLKDMSIKK